MLLLTSIEIELLLTLLIHSGGANETENDVYSKQMRESKTIIVAAHQLSTIVDSDTIYVLEHR